MNLFYWRCEFHAVKRMGWGNQNKQTKRDHDLLKNLAKTVLKSMTQIRIILFRSFMQLPCLGQLVGLDFVHVQQHILYNHP